MLRVVEVGCERKGSAYFKLMHAAWYVRLFNIELRFMLSTWSLEMFSDFPGIECSKVVTSKKTHNEYYRLYVTSIG